MEYETTDVIICGGGPTGIMLSAYLGRYSVSSIVLEREPDITTDPRGIALDEEGIRLLQGLGLYEKIFTDIGRCMGRFNFVGGRSKTLSTKPFMSMNYNTSEGGTGHPGFMSHRQPLIEKNLREAAAHTGYHELRPQSTVTSISEDVDWVYVTYTDATGKDCTLRSKFMVGSDGKTGFTRKKYLEAKGILMEQASQMGYEETWVALNWKLTLPTEKSHPDFPLWRLGYSPEEVFDLFFPIDFRFLCNPERPSVCGRFGPPIDRLWRFEFVIRRDEDGWVMATPEKIKEIVFPYITHSGHRYGLRDDVQFPEDCIEVLRSRPFKFSARSCNKWAIGRVILAGDAAHVFPPFGGQGIASGFRDASSLAWRLVLACRPNFTGNYSKLLTAWYLERKQQLERSLRSTVENGAYCTEGNRTKIFLRDWHLWLIQLVPSWKHWLEMGPRNEGMTKYDYVEGAGMPFLPHIGGGSCFPQVYCKALEFAHRQGEHRAKVRFTDDVIFAENKKSLFQVVVLLDRMEEVKDAKNSLHDVESKSGGEILGDEATFIIHDFNATFNSTFEYAISASENLVRIATGEEFAEDPQMCLNRPRPEYYDAYRMKQEVQGAKFVILRPDRFVYAACRYKKELDLAIESIAEVLELKGARTGQANISRL